MLMMFEDNAKFRMLGLVLILLACTAFPLTLDDGGSVFL
jgi:hypothetical protein